MRHPNADFQPAHRGRWRLGVLRGLRRRCPNCGQGAAFTGYLRLVAQCTHCAHRLGDYRCDDAPPYFTILLVGHLVIPGVLWTEQTFRPEIWLQLAFWLPLTALLSLATLPRIKGAVLGTQWALGIQR